MRYRFSIDHEDVELDWSLNDPGPGRRIDLSDPWVARRFVDRLAARAENRAGLFRLAAERSPSLRSRDADEVAAAIAGWLERGTLRAEAAIARGQLLAWGEEIEPPLPAPPPVEKAQWIASVVADEPPRWMAEIQVKEPPRWRATITLEEPQPQ